METAADRPLVSIVIPCYNAGPMLARCLESCFAQTYPAIEVLVVDNGSTDGSAALAARVARASRREVVQAECAERGPNPTRRRGFELSRGSYVQWLDADDEIGPEKIARQVVALERSPAHDIATGDWTWRFHEEGRPPSEVRLLASPTDDYLLQVLAGNWCPPINYLVRREAAVEVVRAGGMSSETVFGDDWRTFATAAILGRRFLHVAGAVSVYNTWSEKQLSRSTDRRARRSAMRLIGLRLAEVVATQPPERLTALHREFLERGYDQWKPAPAQITRHDGAPRAVPSSRPEPIPLTEPEAKVLAAAQASSTATHLTSVARDAHRILLRRVTRKHVDARGAVDQALVRRDMEILLGVGASGGGEALPRIPDCRVEGEPATVRWFLDQGPTHAPIFAETKYAVLRIVERLCARGLFIREPDEATRDQA